MHIVFTAMYKCTCEFLIFDYLWFISPCEGVFVYVKHIVLLWWSASSLTINVYIWLCFKKKYLYYKYKLASCEAYWLNIIIWTAADVPGLSLPCSSFFVAPTAHILDRQIKNSIMLITLSIWKLYLCEPKKENLFLNASWQNYERGRYNSVY